MKTFLKIVPVALLSLSSVLTTTVVKADEPIIREIEIESECSLMTCSLEEEEVPNFEQYVQNLENKAAEFRYDLYDNTNHIYGALLSNKELLSAEHFDEKYGVTRGAVNVQPGVCVWLDVSGSYTPVRTSYYMYGVGKSKGKTLSFQYGCDEPNARTFSIKGDSIALTQYSRQITFLEETIIYATSMKYIDENILRKEFSPSLPLK